MTSTQQKGNIIENRIVELITLQSNGILNCYQPVADDDGLDIILNKKKEINPIYLQVKSRFNLTKDKSFIQDIREQNLKVKSRFYYVFAYYDMETMDIENIWIVPSKDFKKYAKKKISSKRKDKEGNEKIIYSYRFASRPLSKNISVKWREFSILKREVGNWFLNEFKSFNELPR